MQVTQRTVDAATAPPLRVTAPSSPFDWRRPSDEPAQHTKEQAMTPPPTPPNPASAARATKPRGRAAAGMRTQVFTLLADGPRTRDDIVDNVEGLDAKISYNLIYKASADKLVKMLKDGRYELTSAGKQWLEAHAMGSPIAALPSARATRNKPAGKRGLKKALAQPRIADHAAATTTASRAQRSFRCAIDSDGGFLLTKGGAEIYLDATEHAEMLRYQERMAVVDETAGA